MDWQVLGDAQSLGEIVKRDLRPDCFTENNIFDESSCELDDCLERCFPIPHDAPPRWLLVLAEPTKDNASFSARTGCLKTRANPSL